jgi:hypothetical protein
VHLFDQFERCRAWLHAATDLDQQRIIKLRRQVEPRHPDFHFDVSRKVAPGLYECGAKIALGRWHGLRLDIAGHTCRTFVDGEETLVIEDLHYAGRRGPVALWIGNGTLGHFSNLRVVDRAD